MLYIKALSTLGILFTPPGISTCAHNEYKWFEFCVFLGEKGAGSFV